jgi:hypothetical protein
MRKVALGVVVGFWLCAVPAVHGQQGTASIAGKVTDAQGGVLPGVNITVTNEETGVFREVVTGTEGSYAVTQIIPGRYRIGATLEGFKTLDRRGVTLTVGQTTTLNLLMEVGGLAETLTVTGEAPLVDVSSATVGGHISAEELNDLPSVNRNYMAFVGNVPGTMFLPSAGFLNDTFQANGQPSSANNIEFDGANNTDEQRGSNVGGQTRAANESIAEVQVITNSFDAEWGRASGAVVNAVTKSGTNNITGSAFAFFTGKGVTEKDFFTKANNAEKPDVGKEEWLFLQPRTPGSSAELGQVVSESARSQLFDQRRRGGVEHPVAHRSPGEFEAHVGVPMAARDRAAVQADRRRAGNAEQPQRRNRSGSDAGRHDNERPFRYQGQYDPSWRGAGRNSSCQPGVACAETRIRDLRAVPGWRGHRSDVGRPCARL